MKGGETNTIQTSSAVSDLVMQLGMAHGLYVGLWYSLISVTAKKLNNLQTSVLVAAGLHNEICFTSFIKLASVQFPHSTWESRCKSSCL